MKQFLERSLALSVFCTTMFVACDDMNNVKVDSSQENTTHVQSEATTTPYTIVTAAVTSKQHKDSYIRFMPATHTPHKSPEQYLVTITYEDLSETFDDKELYERVNKGDTIEVVLYGTKLMQPILPDNLDNTETVIPTEVPDSIIVTATVTSKQHKDSYIRFMPATHTPHKSPEQYLVTITYEDLSETFDDRELYEKVNKGDAIEMRLWLGKKLELLEQ